MISNTASLMVVSVASIRVLSPMVNVIFNGFKSDTYTLQRSGWNIAAHEEPYDRRLRIIIENAMLGLTGVSNYSEFDYMRARQYGSNDLPTIVIDRVAPKIMVMNLIEYQTNFKVIDARPTWVNAETTRIEDLHIFNTNLPSKEIDELIVEPQDVASLLEQIHKIQSKDQTVIRENMRRRERLADNIIPKTVARIITLDDYRKAA